jgi:hypothetical protein
MDKVFSARIDEDVLRELDVVTVRLGMTKKSFLEKAIRLAAKSLKQSSEGDVLEAAFGCWKREGSAADAVQEAKKPFRQAAVRHKRGL